ncbi:MAG: hypothetical protein IMZ64_03055, partial [Bacteroidetes bacterium]|nr:hypothetical protein [Bacteroidota bacterium]
WAGGQTESGLAAGNCYWIYIDDSGTIGSATVRTNALFEDYIVLFECLRDSTPITNNQVTVKENHPYNYSSTVSNYQHNVIGTVIENANNGANITLVGTQKVGISGADVLSDHGLDTTIPDSGGAGVVWNKKYTTAAGKWALHNANDTFTGVYNNGGTITALGANKFGVYTLYVSKDSLNAVTPTYFAVPDIAQYNNLAAANLAISNGTTAKATNELLALELAQLGYIIYSQAANAIVSVIIAKATLKQTISTGGTNQAALVNTVVTSFDGWLTAANTNVQSALDTLDDILKAGGAGTVLAGAAGLPTFTATPTVTSITISNAPAAGTDGTNKTYVDTIAAGFDHKDVCVAASTGALTVLYDNGIGGVGATLTNNGALAAFALDGQSPIVGKRVLIKDQATTFQNGIYTVTVVGDGGTAWVLTRATDYDTALEMQNGSLIPVSAGTANVNTMWLQNVTVVDIGTDPVTYQKFQSKPLSSPVAIAEGGTNATAMATTYGVNYFDGTRLVTTAVGTATHVLTSNGAGVAPTFQAIPAQGNVTAAGNITDDYVVTGDGGAKGVQVSSMKIDANGQMTNTTQPAFCAYNSATDTNQTGNSAVVTIDFDTEVYDQNGDFAADTFTAPITGKYALTTNVRTTDLSAAMTAANMDIVTSNRTIRYNWNPYNGSVAGLNSSAVLTTVLDMDANDTAIVQVTIANGAGDTASISGHATFLFTSFSGYLAC